MYSVYTLIPLFFSHPSSTSFSTSSFFTDVASKSLALGLAVTSHPETIMVIAFCVPVIIIFSILVIIF